MTTPLSTSIALAAAIGLCLLVAGLLRWHRRQAMQRRVHSLGLAWKTINDERHQTWPVPGADFNPHNLAGRLGARVARRLPGEVGSLAKRVDRAGLTGGVPTVELVGWKVVCTFFGGAVGVWFVVRFGAVGLLMLIAGLLVGWCGIDFMLLRYHALRRRAILRDLPTVMDLLVLSLEAGMGLDRALRTITHDYRSVLCDEIRRVLHDVELGLGRGGAFERMALRVGLEDLRSVSRAIVQSDSWASAW
jgi:tight adherence protein C